MSTDTTSCARNLGLGDTTACYTFRFHMEHVLRVSHGLPGRMRGGPSVARFPPALWETEGRQGCGGESTPGNLAARGRLGPDLIRQRCKRRPCGPTALPVSGAEPATQTQTRVYQKILHRLSP